MPLLAPCAHSAASLLAATFLVSVAATGCIHVDAKAPAATAQARPKGPPAHAPAHGWRRKQKQQEVIWSTRLGVYVVVGHRHHYYDGKRYYRRVGDGWQASASLGGSWVGIASRELPEGLRLRSGGYGHVPAAPAERLY